MDNLTNLALIAQMIDSAEKNIQSAKQLLREILGGKIDNSEFAKKAQDLTITGGGKIIEGVFDGQNMIGPDNKQYPVPANYASKSKLIEGDVLKLTIADDGSFIYKQIGPIERKKVMGILTQDDKGEYRVVADSASYRILLASLTYFKADVGDQVTVVIPADKAATWGAVENVIKAGDPIPDDREESGSGKSKDSDETELEEI